MKLYLLNFGYCDVDKGMVLTPGSGVGERITIPIVGYLIETDDGQHILVDTGMHRKHIEDPQATFRGHPFGQYLTPIMRPEDDIVNRLGELGLTVDDIDILVSTHFHFDHAGNHADFGASRIVTQRECYEYAKANPAAFPQDIWDLPHLNYEMIDGDVEIAPGVQFVESSGHVPGHMSVVLRLPQTGTVVLAIDAIYTLENLQKDNWDGQVDPVRGRPNGHKLAEIAKCENGLLITGHDPGAWADLKIAPHYYE
ncbi:MAG: N-acyl homoserine lactone hydrolase [Thermomicrobiales bacterium]|nr:N-acyl homoserine lactone hydrolase [Thermomicrobiales bacterium]